MKGIHYIIAVIVIVCLIFWRKSIVNKRDKGQKSIDSPSKAKNNSKKEDLHKMSEAQSSKQPSASKLTEVKDKEAYDGSRKKDRGKKRRQKKNTNSAIDEIKKKTEEVKEKTEAEAKKLERKAEAKAEEVKAETKAKVEEVKKEAKEIKEKAEAKAEKVTEEVKEKAQDVKKEAEVKTEEVKEEVSKESKKVQAKAKEVKVETQAKAEEVKKEAKEIKEKAEVKAEKVIEEVKDKAHDVKKEAEDVKDKAQVKAEEVKEEVKDKAQAVKEEVKEEKAEIENKIASTGNYPDLITSLKNNPWTSDDLNTRVKFEDIRRQVTLHEEEITDLPLDKIKTSLSPESLVDFLNMTSAKPTILNRKEDTSYEFTTRDPKEIDLIKNRYGLLDREIDKITSVLIFDKEGQKLKEVKDVLAEGKNRIYMETKF